MKNKKSDDDTPKKDGAIADSSETEYSEWDNRKRTSGEDQAAAPSDGARLRVKKTATQRNQESKLPVVLEANAPWSEAKKRSVKERVFWSCVMVSMFAVVIAMGHLYLAFLVIALTMGMFHEVIGLKRNKEKDNKIPWFLTMRWYFFVLAEFYAIKRLLPPSHELEIKIKEIGGQIPYLLFVRYYTFTVYLGFLGGLIFFVLSLRKFTLKYQFHQLGWAMLTILLIVMQSCAHVSNIYSGIVWFLLSTTLVITNDVFAYIVGIRFGKTPLIALSPKKTVEGFFGGSVFTCIWAVFAVNILSKMDFFLCPQPDLVGLPFMGISNLHCSEEVTTQFFETVVFRIPGVQYLTADPEAYSFSMSMLSVHATVMALFASLVAPFGGFFASGFKRAFRIKDFGDLIPGHGGLTDRFDCQIVMGLFCHVYLHTFVYSSAMVSVDVMKKLAESLSPQDRQELVNHLMSLGRGY
ncbi:unnamed protein product [Amoebophrya sp. A120]|nr:unnamed protein product [Amoebophrya sp. A120]|eukprot:GSA120T00005922001.1